MSFLVVGDPIEKDMECHVPGIIGANNKGLAVCRTFDNTRIISIEATNLGDEDIPAASHCSKCCYNRKCNNRLLM